MPVVIVQPGEKLATLAGYPGDFADWMLCGLGLPATQARVVRPHRGEPLPSRADAVVVTGSSAMVTDGADWIRETAAWLGRMLDQRVPVLGVCFGHQLLAHALGGEVRDNPRGIEVGTVETRVDGAAGDDPLFGGFTGVQLVQASHRQSVVRLPEGAVPLAASARDPHHAFRWGERAWGIQFHPEFDRQIVRAYVEYYGAQLAAQGEDMDALIAEAVEVPAAIGLLAAFAGLIEVG